MPRLIVLNGPPGVGKSTLARRYLEDHPLALDLDIDRIRGLLGRWSHQPTQAGLLARDLSLAMAGVHLAAGHDVIIPQYFGAAAFLDQAEQLAVQTGAGFHELVLLDSMDNAVRRFLTRAAITGLPAHQHAHRMLDHAGGPPVLAEMYDRLHQLIATRPHARIINCHEGQIEQAYQAIIRHLIGLTR